MNRLFFCLLFLILAAALPVTAQRVTYSGYEREDNRDMNFEILGKMNGNFLVYKNINRWKHRISIFGDDMKTIETVDLDFVPDKTFNVDFVVYPDFFYMIYQYQKKNILYCKGVKMDAMGKKMSEPIDLDTTNIGVLADNKIYSTIHSEDKQKIMIFKIHKKNERYSIINLLFDNQLKLISKSREGVDFDERRESYGDFLVDNDGNFVFTTESRQANRENSNRLTLAIKAPHQDTFSYHAVELEKNFIDNVSLKIDNLNKRYIINSFYYNKSRGNIIGLFNATWDRGFNRIRTTAFIPLWDSLRAEAKGEGLLRFALEDFFIRQAYVRKDGGYILTAEDFSSQSRGSGFGNSWNRWDYLNNYPYNSPGYYYYSPYRDRYYRSISSFGNQSTRYYYENILVMSMDKYGKLEWAKVIHKDQLDDDNDNYLSFTTMNSGGEIHFLFNEDRKNQIIADYSLAPGGTLKRNPTLKSQEKNYEFMPRHAKQVGARQMIVPCVYRTYICFAKVDL